MHDNPLTFIASPAFTLKARIAPPAFTLKARLYKIIQVRLKDSLQCPSTTGCRKVQFSGKAQGWGEEAGR